MMKRKVINMLLAGAVAAAALPVKAAADTDRSLLESAPYSNAIGHTQEDQDFSGKADIVVSATIANDVQKAAETVTGSAAIIHVLANAAGSGFEARKADIAARFKALDRAYTLRIRTPKRRI